MIQRWVSTVLSLLDMAGPMVALYLLCNVAVLFSSFLAVGAPATVVLLFTAIRLAGTPREKFIEKRQPWSTASIANERALMAAAVALHLASCAATLFAVWFAIPAARPVIPLISGIAAMAAIAAGTWGWFRARKPWCQYGLW